jgi:peptide/nickel transport system substrate-binding protein
MNPIALVILFRILMRRTAFAVLVASVTFGAGRLAAQHPSAIPGTVIIATASEAPTPVPTLYSNDVQSREIGDQLFLRLAEPGRIMRTDDESNFEPRLAKSWSHRDSVTLVFELDPRARWQDGVPFTAEDVVFTINRARDPATDAQIAGLLKHITAVEAEGEHRVVFHFDRRYPEQLYDATFHQPPLPAHLVKSIAAADLAKSEFVAHPIGNGPFRWVRRIPEQKAIELVADTAFFLGRPGIGRVIFEAVPDAEARANLLQAGEVDAIDNVYQLPNAAALLALPGFQQVPMVTFSIGFMVMNQRDPADTSRPHPILADPAVRRALTEALDREALAHTGYGSSAVAPPGPVSQGLWVFDRRLARFGYDTAAARRDLAKAGWTDHDGDGVLDRNGKPLRLALMLVSSAAPRRRMGEQAQEMFRRIGVDLQLLVVERGEYIDRRNAGQYDLEFLSSNQDPTPSGLTQTWQCGGLNTAHYCDPVFDSLTQAAIFSSKSAPAWRKALERIIDDAPAIWVYSPTFVGLIHQRFTNVSMRPQSTWVDLWRWRLKPGAELPRDRGER